MRSTDQQPLKQLFRAIPRYVAAYLFGIVACVVSTPAEWTLAGVALWPSYLIFGVIGFVLFFFYLAPEYSVGPGFLGWTAVLIGMVPLAFGIASRVSPRPWLRAWRPLWIGFPVGFVGTLGVFYTAAASI